MNTPPRRYRAPVLVMLVALLMIGCITPPANDPEFRWIARPPRYLSAYEFHQAIKTQHAPANAAVRPADREATRIRPKAPAPARVGEGE